MTQRPRLSQQELDQGRREFDPRSIRRWPGIPLPIDADDDFDERLLRTWPDCPEEVASRLQDLPLTRWRARRILDLTLNTGHFWGLEKATEIAKAVGVVAETVPQPDLWSLSAEKALALQALMGVEAANERLGKWIDELTEAGDLRGALRVATVEPSLLTDGRKDALRQLALREGVDAMISRLQSHPWLITERDVVEVAADEKHDWTWSRCWPAKFPLPQFLAPIMEARAVSVVEPETGTMLLDHLETLFAESRRDVLALAVERLRKGGPSSLPVDWLAKKLNTKSLWDDPGREIVAVLLAPYDEDGAARVRRLCIDATVRESDPRLEPAMHTVVGSALLDAAARALQDQNSKLAKNALTGLAFLSPASRLHPRVRHLKRLPGSEAVLPLIEVNEKLLRRATNRDAASVDDICDALRALSEGDGDDECGGA